MVRFRCSTICLSAFLLAFLPACRAQDSVSASRKALASVFHDYDEETLRHTPELSHGKYSDQLDDLSIREVNEHLEHERGLLARMGEIDLAGLTAKERTDADQLEKTLIQDEERAPLKAWETPLDPANGFQVKLEKLASGPFTSVKDYDDYIARLKKVPDQFRQVISNMMLGIDDGKVQPAATVQAILTQVQATASHKPEESLLAAPLKQFPAAVPPASRQRIADDLFAAIQDDVLPAYARFGRFLTAQVLPAAQKQAAK